MIGSLAVVGSVLLAGTSSVLAADTKYVDFRSPGAVDNFLILPSTTNVGGVSAYDLTLTNVGPSTLTQVRVSGGDQAPDPLANPLSIPGNVCTGTTPDTCVPALPTYTDASSGVTYTATIADVYVLRSTITVGCFTTAATATSGDTGFYCDVANMAVGASATIRVLVQLPPEIPAGTYPVYAAVQMKEGSSTTGSNADVRFARGDITVADASCGGVYKFFNKDDGALASLSNATFGATVPRTCPQRTDATTGNDPSRGTFLSVEVTSGTSALLCLPGYKCFGDLSIVSLQPQLYDPNRPGPVLVKWYVKWTWGTNLPKVNPKGFIHFRDTYPVDPTAYDVVPFSAKGKCADPATSTGCWTQQGSDNKTYFEAWLQTLDNGSGRGF
jgi:hypothetical protein